MFSDRGVAVADNTFTSLTGALRPKPYTLSSGKEDHNKRTEHTYRTQGKIRQVAVLWLCNI